MNAILFWIGMAVAIGTVAGVVYRICRWGAAVVKGLADVAIGIDLLGSQLLDLNVHARAMADLANRTHLMWHKGKDFTDPPSDPVSGQGYCRRRKTTEDQEA